MSASSAPPRRFTARVTIERRLSLADARYVLALAEALPRSPDAVALLLRTSLLPVTPGRLRRAITLNPTTPLRRPDEIEASAG
jgi:hypothetical protein